MPRRRSRNFGTRDEHFTVAELLPRRTRGMGPTTAGGLLRSSISERDLQVLRGELAPSQARLQHLQGLLLVDEHGQLTTLGRSIIESE